MTERLEADMSIKRYIEGDVDQKAQRDQCDEERQRLATESMDAYRDYAESVRRTSEEAIDRALLAHT